MVQQERGMKVYVSTGKVAMQVLYDMIEQAIQQGFVRPVVDINEAEKILRNNGTLVIGKVDV